MVTREEKNKKLQQEIKKEDNKRKRNKIFMRFLLLLLILILIIIGLYSYMHFIGTKGLVVREYKVVNSKLPDNLHGFKIVHFSDLHYLSTVNKNDLKNMVTTINKLKPDVVVFTGDLTDSEIEVSNNDLNDMIELFNKIKVTTGLYAIKGNHDYSNNNFDLVFSQTDFKVLDNSYDLIYYHDTIPILITGIGSDLQGDMDIGKAYSYNETDNIFTISLLHEPDYIDEILLTNQVDLALSGHSHNGQVRLPFIGALQSVEGAKKYKDSYYKINNTDLYISGGMGTSIFKIRFFNRPSINFYRLVEK